jgi:sec-independent protein translocase protein TatA
MGFGSPIHWIVLGIIVILLFGGGRFSSMMSDVAKGVKSFKKGMAEDDDDDLARRPAPRLQNQPPVDPAPTQAPQPMKDDRPSV